MYERKLNVVFTVCIVKKKCVVIHKYQLFRYGGMLTISVRYRLDCYFFPISRKSKVRR
jgi:hypothetical protein